MQTGVAEDNLEPALSGRISLENCVDLLFDRAKHNASSMVPDQKGRNMMVSRDQNRTRSPSWICRGSAAARYCPNVERGAKVVPQVVFTNVIFTWFIRLNASPRIWTRNRS